MYYKTDRNNKPKIISVKNILMTKSMADVIKHHKVSLKGFKRDPEDGFSTTLNRLININKLIKIIKRFHLL